MKKSKSKKGRNSMLMIVSFLAITFFMSSCMTMGLGHLSPTPDQYKNHPNEISYVDPVCGNSMEQVSEDLSYEYGGTTYYFHSLDCLNEFKQAPENYIANNNINNHRNNYGMMWGLGAAAMIGMMLLMIL
ncbi:MAG: YHS domain-containing protein [Candidatus Cyclobacteriaceae bacterium M3_2C_046]